MASSSPFTEPAIKSESASSPRESAIKSEPASSPQELAIKSEPTLLPGLTSSTTKGPSNRSGIKSEGESNAGSNLEARFPEFLLKLKESFDDSESRLQETFEAEARPSDSQWFALIAMHLIAANKYLEAYRDLLQEELSYGQINQEKYVRELRKTRAQIHKNDIRILQTIRHHQRWPDLILSDELSKQLMQALAGTGRKDDD